jgi:hypothetical protein
MIAAIAKVAASQAISHAGPITTISAPASTGPAIWVTCHVNRDITTASRS